jgi:hypothetical protein
MARPSQHAAQREAIFPRGRKAAAVAALSLPFGFCLRLIPYAFRLRAARGLAAPIALAATVLGSRTAMSGLTVRERMIGRVLSMLHYQRVPFPADVSIASDSTLAGPLLVLVRHSLLNQLVISRLVRDGLPVSMVMNDPPGRYRAFGSDLLVDILPLSAMLMRTIGACLRQGRIVFVAIDVTDPQQGFRKMETTAGPWFLADQPIRLALKLGVPVAVAIHDFRSRHVVTHIRRLPGADADQIVTGFCEAFGVVVRPD